MSEINFSKEQLQAIELKNSSLLVSAAAGSGKTAVLVERIIRKITEDNISINEMLIVTFTNAAASGMKKKIKKAIKERLRTDKNNFNLRKQLMLIENANISTVHSFCLNLLKNNSHMLPREVPVGFNLMNDTERELLRTQILKEIIADLYESDDILFAKLSESYGGGRNDDNLVEIALLVYDFLISIPDYKNWVKKSLELISHGDFYNSPYSEKLFIHIHKIYESAVSKYRYALDFIEGDELLEPYKEPFSREFMYFKKGTEIDNLYELLDFLHTSEFVSLAKHKAKKGADTEIPQAIRKSVKDEIEKLKIIYSNEIIEINLKSTENTDIIYKLFDIVLKFDEKFKQEKYEMGVLDFNDLEHLTIGLLCEDGKLREEFYPLRDSFKEILVDEYQDTNDVQETIFMLLSKGDNLFTVGDVKQSIYRFRHANPALFIDRMNSYRKLKCGNVVNLNANYRCHENIVNTVNTIFSFLMTEDIARINYKEEEKLICRGNFGGLPAKKLACEVKIALTDRADEETAQTKEAKMLAASITRMVEDEEFILDGHRVSYRDITILVRSFNDKTLSFLSELAKYGIPVTYEDKTQFFDTVEIKSIIALLKVIDNPYDDISLISVLRNIFSYSDDRLAEIRLADRKVSFYEAMKISENIEDKKILKYLSELKSYSLRYDLKSFLNKIYDETFFAERQLRFANGYKRMENAERLLDIAGDFEQTEFKGLSSFISYVDRIISEKKKFANARLTDEADTVKVMSVHKSKGLEFPVVILTGMDKPFNRMDFISNIILNTSLGIGYNVVNCEKQYKYKSVYRNIIEAEEKKELLLEEMRILYVALTRAKYKLIMSGCINNKEDWYNKYFNTLLSDSDDISYLDFLKLNSYFDMVLPPLLRQRNTENSLSERNDKWIENNDFSLRFDVISDTEGEEESKEAVDFSDIKGDLSAEEYEEIDKKVSFRYFDNLKGIPKKISVTELKNALDDSDEENAVSYPGSIYVPDFRLEGGITARERGILIHYIFEKIDLNLLRKSDNKMKVLLNFIDDNEYLKDKLTHSDLKKAEAFFNNPIGIKLLRAKEVHREKDFLMRMDVREVYKNVPDASEKVIVQGIIDCYFVDTKGEVYLIDYKYVSGSEKYILKEYKYQIDLYRQALSKSLHIKPESIKAYIWDVSRCISIQIPF